MKKDITDLIKLINKKTDKPEGELVSLCRYREDKAYIKQRTEKITNLENLREELKNAEYHLFNFLTIVDDGTPKNKLDRLIIEHIRFLYDQWSTVKDVVDQQIKRVKTNDQ